MHDLVGAYAVDALPGDERRFFERHLAECAGCRVEVDELQATGALLGMAAAEEPPSGLRERVLAAAAATDQERPAPDDEWDRAPGATPGERAPAESRPVAAEPTEEGWRDRMRRLLPAVAAVIVLGAAGLAVAVTRTSPPAPADQLAELISAPDARVLDLTAPKGATARFVWSAERSEGLLVTEGLPAPPEGHAYALWVIDAEAPALVGTFLPDEGGHAARAVGAELATATAIAVTVERDERPEQPTSDPLIHGLL